MPASPASGDVEQVTGPNGTIAESDPEGDVCSRPENVGLVPVDRRILFIVE